MRNRYLGIVCILMLVSICISGCSSSDVESNDRFEETSEVVSLFEPETTIVDESKSVFVTSAELNVRAGVGTSYDVLYTTKPGETLQLTGEKEINSNGTEWYEVYVPGELNTGWVSSKYGSIKNESSRKIELVEKNINALPIESFDFYDGKNRSVRADTLSVFSFLVNPVGINEEDILFDVSDQDIIGIDNIEYKDYSNGTQVSITLKGLNVGNAVLSILSTKSGEVVESVECKCFQSIITDFERMGPYKGYRGEKNTTAEPRWKITPNTITKDDFRVEISDKSVIKIQESNLEEINGEKYFSCTVKLVKDGESELKLVASDGEFESEPISFNVSTPVYEHPVYITNTGEKYHYSASCAGSSAKKVERDDAIKMGYSPCGKCAR